ncbi:MAG: hypothetical protein LIP04_01745 [Tannerellaceae bacterium]|nr:hypothetical protein [Tannerellaceae bacterium]
MYRKHEIPASFHYGTNPHISDLIVVADCGWQFGTWPSSTLGAHGYDIYCPDMQVIFFAYGPDFKTNYQGALFDNTAIYLLLSVLSGVEPAPGDGDINQILPFLQTKD